MPFPLGGGQDKKRIPIPRRIPGLVCFLRADSIVGLSSGELLTTWLDESGKGRNATAIVNEKPTFTKNARNGLPAVRFTPTDTIRMTISSLGLEYTGITEGTFFVVYGVSDSDAQYDVCSFSPITTEHWRFSGDGGMYSTFFRADRLSNSPTAQPTSGYHYFTIRSGPVNNYDIRRNGVLVTEAATNWGAGTHGKIAQENDGGWLAGDICEILFYTRELTDAEVAVIENYLKSKWAL